MIDLINDLRRKAKEFEDEVLEDTFKILKKNGSKYQLCIKTGEIGAIEKFKEYFDDLEAQSKKH